MIPSEQTTLLFYPDRLADARLSNYSASLRWVTQEALDENSGITVSFKRLGKLYQFSTACHRLRGKAYAYSVSLKSIILGMKDVVSSKRRAASKRKIEDDENNGDGEEEGLFEIFSLCKEGVERNKIFVLLFTRTSPSHAGFGEPFESPEGTSGSGSQGLFYLMKLWQQILELHKITIT